MAWYNTGTIALTNGSATVTGSGTNFLVGAQIGEALYAPDGKLYEIQTINSATVITLASNYLGSTASTQGYQIIPTQSLVADLASDVTDLISDFADVRDYAGNGKFNDGAVGTPGITFTQDQDNGLYRIGSNNWALAAGGQQVVNLTTTAMNFPDNNKAIFGAGSDLQIYSDGTTGQVTGNVNVTGTVTADGLTVDGALSSGGITTTGNTSAAAASAGDGRLFPNNTYGAFVYGNGTTYDVALGQRSTGVALGVLAGTTNVVIPTGNVGIGTTSVGTNNGAVGLKFGLKSAQNNIISGESSGSNFNGIILESRKTGRSVEERYAQIEMGESSDNGLIKFYTAPSGSGISERLRIDSSGNVGIGVTPEAWTAFNPVLRIKNASTGGGGALAGSGVDNFRMFANTYYDGAYKRLDTGFATQYGQESGQHVWSYAASGAGDSTITWSEAMRIDASGHAIIPAGVTLGTAAGVYAAANTLDSYEEGSWTPVLTGTGYSFGTHTGRYVKVGNLVYITALFNVTTVGSNTSIIGWTGAPFTTESVTNLHQMGVVRESSNTGYLYQIQINAGGSGGSMNSMDGIDSGSNKIFTTGNYAVSITYKI
jgi:hypothetical protein